MKRRNGFTLIELLAVIVILAIIAVIATPIIVGIIEDARKSAAADSAYGALDAVEKYYTQSLLSTTQATLPLTVDFGAQADTDTAIAGTKVTMSGTKPTAGTVTLVSDGTFCVGTYDADAQTPCTTGTLTVNNYACTYSADGKFTCSK